MPLHLGRIRADAEISDRAAVLPRRTVGQSCIPEPESIVVSVEDRDLLQAVLAGLYRLSPGAAR